MWVVLCCGCPPVTAVLGLPVPGFAYTIKTIAQGGRYLRNTAVVWGWAGGGVEKRKLLKLGSRQQQSTARKRCGARIYTTSHKHTRAYMYLIHMAPNRINTQQQLSPKATAAQQTHYIPQQQYLAKPLTSVGSVVVLGTWKVAETSSRAGWKMSQIMVTVALVGTDATDAQWQRPMRPTPMIPT